MGRGGWDGLKGEWSKGGYAKDRYFSPLQDLVLKTLLNSNVRIKELRNFSPVVLNVSRGNSII